MTRFMLILLLVLGLQETAAALEVIFKPVATVEGAAIRLADVADLDEESARSQAIATQIVGQSPPAGETILLHSQSIRQLLLSTQQIPVDTTWSGTPRISVTRQGMSIGPEDIQAIIAEYLLANSRSLPKAAIRFIPEALPLPFTLPTGNLIYDVFPSNPAILGSSRFSIIFKVDNKVVKNMSVRGKIEALANIVVAAQTLKSGTILTPQHLSTMEMDVNDIEKPLFSVDELFGKKITRSMRAGTPILASLVESQPLVRRGQKVKIVINSGKLQLSATGYAHSDGMVDQMIKVQNLASNKTIYGRITAPGLVEVIL